MIEKVLNDYDVAGVVGNGAAASVLQEANVQKADVFISATCDDELNLACCKMASLLGAKNLIAKIRDTDYTNQVELIRSGFNIDEIVNMEFSTAEEIAKLLRFPFATNAISFEKGKVVCVEVKIPQDCKVTGNSIKSLIEEFNAELTIGVIRRADKIIIPDDQEIIMADDFVTFISTPRNIDAFFKKSGIFNQKVKTVIVIGGSRIAYHLVRKLQEVGIKVKIIEKSEVRSNLLVSTLDKVEVVCADGTQKQVLDEEGLNDCDACVSLTDIDELNIIISLYAKSKNVETVISKVNNNTFTEILKDINLDTYISPKNIAADQILSFVRNQKANGKHSILSLHKLMDDNLELLELIVCNDDAIISKSINELKLKKGIVIAGVIRKGTFIVHTGETVIEEGDKIIVATTLVLEQVDSILK